MSIGIKHDQDKPTWCNLPMECIQEVVEVSSHGAKKYGVMNWKSLDRRQDRYFDAAMRHIMSWRRGERRDKETKRHHLAHAVCCLLYCMWGDK